MKLIELCHIYWKDFLEDNIKINFKKELDLLNMYKNQSEVRTIVLIDDMGLDELASREDVVSNLKTFFSSEGIFINDFFFESDCSKFAPLILEKLPKDVLVKESFDRGKSTRTFLVENGKKIPLFKEIDGNVFYTCPLLSAVWVLIKNGHIDILNFKTKPDSSITILPEYYRATENNVTYILACADYQFTISQINDYY